MSPKDEEQADWLKQLKEQFTDHELHCAGKNLARRKSHIGMRVKVVPSDDPGKAPSLTYQPEHPLALYVLAECFGSGDLVFSQNLIAQLANAAKVGGVLDEQRLNFMIAVIKDVGPRDQLEAMLAAQMATVHTAAMTSGQHFAEAETKEQRGYAESALNRLTRTFSVQLEALKRYRTGGEHRITVRHLSDVGPREPAVSNVVHGREKAPPDSSKHHGAKHNGSKNNGSEHNGSALVGSNFNRSNGVQRAEEPPSKPIISRYRPTAAREPGGVQ
jgi:hypothetical protein